MTTTAKRVYQALAACFVSEGVRTQFVLMGDGNMHMVTCLQEDHGVTTVHVRHENSAIGAAMGFHSATGEVGVASVTCGPGFSQTLTALISAARGLVPMVVFAGEAPIGARFYHQHLDQAPFAALCGAHYIAAHSVDRMPDQVCEAFYIARTRRKPVVLGVPYDLQNHPMPDKGRYEPSHVAVPESAPVAPDPRRIADLADLLRAARHPVLIGGRGALHANASPVITELADRSGALLAHTLPARGLFDHHPFSLGVCGGYARPASLPQFAAADLVIAFGASLSYYTLHGGQIFPDARIVQISLEPEGRHQGLHSAHLHLAADARLAAEALLAALGDRPGRAAVSSDALAAMLQVTPVVEVEQQVEPGTLNPFRAFEELERVIPKDYDAISGTGHQTYFHTTMRGYDPRRYHHMRDFGAVGLSLSQAIGVAAARGDGRVVLFDGDGSLMMYLGELETIARQGLKLLIVCLNDGGYGAEIHKLRADGLPSASAEHGRPDFAAVARGLGLRGATVRDCGAFGALMRDYEAGEAAMVWDVHASDQVISPSLLHSIRIGHGVR